MIARGERMEREIAEQPSVLADAWPLYERDTAPLREEPPFDLVVLVARGSSDNAAVYARYLVEAHLGVPVSLAAPSVLTRLGGSPRYGRALVVGISQSGMGPDVAEVVGYARENGAATLALTNDSDSLLSRTAHRTVLLRTGPETSIAATKTYTATLLALYATVRALGADLPTPGTLPDETWLERCREAAEEGSGPFVRLAPSFALGRGYAFATALETSLKLMECALLPCKAFSVADFEHGPKALAGAGSVALSYAGPLPALEERGCEVVLAPEPPSAPELAPLYDAIFAQRLALAAARARGLDPDDARFLQKVTRTR